MNTQTTEDIPSIVIADLFSRGYPREEPAVMRCSVAGVIVEVVMAAHLDRVECTYWCDIDRYSPRDAQHIIPVSWTVPNYGGYRTGFTVPTRAASAASVGFSLTASVSSAANAPGSATPARCRRRRRT